MRTLKLKADERVAKVRFTEDEKLTVDLRDGRTIIVPLAWSPRLDEDLSTEGLLRGAPAPDFIPTASRQP